MVLFFLFNLIILINFTFAQKYAAKMLYDDLKCKNVNLITFSYDKLEICDNNIILNKCNIFNQNANFSAQSFCGFNSLEYTKQKFKDDFIYMEIYDNDCRNKTGAIAIILNKCISFMNTTYIKITKDKNIFNSKTYSDINCKNYFQGGNNKEIAKNFQESLNIQLCSDDIYTKDGLFKNLTITDKKNEGTDVQNKANNEKNSLILTFSLMIIMIIAFANHY